MNYTKLWLLKPINNSKQSLWDPWYDKAFGFVVRASTASEARAFAQAKAGTEAEGSDWQDESTNIPVWTSPELTSCELLVPEGEEGIVLRDFRAA